MSILVSAIEWDTDGVDADKIELPTELSVDAAAEGIADAAHLSDWLSDKYGWTILSLSCDPPFNCANA